MLVLAFARYLITFLALQIFEFVAIRDCVISGSVVETILSELLYNIERRQKGWCPRCVI